MRLSSIVYTDLLIVVATYKYIYLPFHLSGVLIPLQTIYVVLWQLLIARQSQLVNAGNIIQLISDS